MILSCIHSCTYCCSCDCVCILQLNGQPVENLSVVEARKLIDKSKDKLQLTVVRDSAQVKPQPSPSPTHQHEQPGELSDNILLCYCLRI